MEELSALKELMSKLDRYADKNASIHEFLKKEKSGKNISFVMAISYMDNLDMFSMLQKYYDITENMLNPTIKELFCDGNYGTGTLVEVGDETFQFACVDGGNYKFTKLGDKEAIILDPHLRCKRIF